MDSQGNDVTHDGLSPEKRPVSPRYVIPFGRVPVAGDTEPPDNETMVGRESERAHFIDMLVSRGATGAYLITGRRGAGKSNFVRHCLNEYNNSVFKRFLRNNSGKSFWDLLGLMIFTGFLIVAALLLTDFLKIETQINLPSQGQGRNGLLLVLAIPTTILCLYPILYTRQVFEVLLRVLRTGGKDRRPNRSASPFAAMITVSLSVICWFLMPPAPMIMVAIYFSMLCLVYAVVQIFSYGSDKSSTDVSGCSEKGDFISLRGVLMKYTFKKNVFWRAKWLLFAVYCLIPLMVFRYYGDSIDQVINSSENSYSRLSVWFIIMMNGFFFLSCGFLARARHLNKRLHRALVGKAFRNSSAWYFAGSVLLFPVLSIGLYLSPLGNNVKTTDIIGIFKNYYFQGLAVCCLIYLFFALEWIISRRKETRPDVDPTAPGATGPHFRPQPALLLAFKGVGGIILGIQLAYPAISFSKELIFYHFLMDATASRTLFNDNQEEILWAFSVFFTLCAIYYMEYEWILRPLVVARDESSLDPAKRSPWEDQKSRHTTSPQRFQFRQMARLTFPWSACTIWLPTLTVTVNLGFEEMDHKRVVHAMLAGLRTEYHRLFLAWHSSVANIIRFISLLLLMVLVAQIGRAWFELPPISKIEKRIAEIGKGPVWNPAVSSSACEIYEKALKGYKDQNLLPALNYIGIYSLEMRPGLRFSCSLPMRDMVISTLYFDILSIPGIQGFEESSRLLLLFTDAN